MENVAKLYLRYKDLQDIYTDGTLEAILGVRRLFSLIRRVIVNRRGVGIFHSDQAQIRLPSSL